MEKPVIGGDMPMVAVATVTVRRFGGEEKRLSIFFKFIQRKCLFW